MLLRRITKHVKEQNWFAVGIDFVIVVIGVFLGIQIGNWNDARQDQRSAKDYHVRLITDVELSIERNNLQISQSQQEMGQLDLVLKALNDCTLNDDDRPAFAAGLYNMGKFDLPIMVTGTIDELNATGNFPLIGTPDLRRAISETVREYQTKIAIDPQITGRSIPSVNYVRTRVMFDLAEYEHGLRAIDSSAVRYDFQGLCADEQFAHAVATVREMTLANMGLNKQMVVQQSMLLEKLLDEKP